MLVREWKEVQKMPRLRPVYSLLLCAALAHAGLLPEGFEGATRVLVRKAPLPDAEIWKECGLQDSEYAEYSQAAQGVQPGQFGRPGEAAKPARKFSITAWRFTDTTSSVEAFQFLRPVDSQPSDLTKMAAVKGIIIWAVYGNYLLVFDGIKPLDEDVMAQLILSFPRFEQAAFPVLPGFFPTAGKIRNSEKYLLGPASLAKFAPGISPSMAAFSMGAEGQTARYKTPEGEMNLTLLSYPTPHIAKERLAEFQQLKGIRVKRSSVLLAIATDFPNPDTAERLLSEVRYEANVTINVKVNSPEPQIGDIVLTGVKFSVILFGFSVLAGFGLRWFRLLISRLRGVKTGELDEEMTVLNLGGNRK